MRDPPALDRRQGRPGRLVFTAAPGPAVVVGMLDLGDRFRLVLNEVELVEPEEGLPRLPVARALWKPKPDFSTAAEAWLRAGRPAWQCPGAQRTRQRGVRRPRGDRRDRAARHRRHDPDPRRRQRAPLEPGVLPARRRALVQHAELRERVLEANIGSAAPASSSSPSGMRARRPRRRGWSRSSRAASRYERLTPAAIAVVDIESGAVVDGRTRPSSDTPTHLVLYRAWPDVGGIVHTHSSFATAWAQAGEEIPCYGTTHADHFDGAVPVTRPLNAAEIASEYERTTGEVILETFVRLAPEPLGRPAVLVALSRAVLGVGCLGGGGGRERDRASRRWRPGALRTRQLRADAPSDRRRPAPAALPSQARAGGLLRADPLRALRLHRPRDSGCTTSRTRRLRRGKCSCASPRWVSAARTVIGARGRDRRRQARASTRARA